MEQTNKPSSPLPDNAQKNVAKPQQNNFKKPRPFGDNKPKRKQFGEKKFNDRNQRRPDSRGEQVHRLGDSERSNPIPDLQDGNIRIIHFGGVEEIGRNMSMIEYKDTILIVDCGIQFSESHTPGIEFILPNTEYLEARKHKIKGALITHGHLDHIGAVPYIFPRIGNPPIFARLFTSLMIRKRQEEFPQLDALDLRVVENESSLQLGSLRVRFFAVSHAIPDSMGIIIETPYGDIVHTGDLRLEHDNGVPSEQEIQRYELFKNRKNLVLMADSTNCENPGFSISDTVVLSNIDQIIRNTSGRLIISTFSSQVERMLHILKSCEDMGKKVAVEGRSIKTNIAVAKLANMLTIKPETLIAIEDIDKYPIGKVVVLATGAQGEEFAALGRIANKTHKHIRLSTNDTILLSSSIVPGNERAVQNLKDKLSRQGAHLIHYKTSDIHSSGHANADELEWIHKKIKPKFFIPVHGYHYMLRVHGDLERRIGLSEENIVIPDNGLVIEIQNQGQTITTLKDKAPHDLIVVDGNSVGKIQDVVVRDRQLLAEDGMFVIVAVVDQRTGKLKKSPDLISRGFVYLKESQDLLRQARILIKKTIEDDSDNMREYNVENVKAHVTDVVSKFLLQKTQKRPVVIPVVLDF